MRYTVAILLCFILLFCSGCGVEDRGPGYGMFTDTGNRFRVGYWQWNCTNCSAYMRCPPGYDSYKCSSCGKVFSSPHGNAASDSHKSGKILSPQQEYNQALTAYNRALEKLNETRLLVAAPKLYPHRGLTILGGMGEQGMIMEAERQVEIARQRLQRAQSRLNNAEQSTKTVIIQKQYDHQAYCTHCGKLCRWNGNYSRIRCPSCSKVFVVSSD